MRTKGSNSCESWNAYASSASQDAAERYTQIQKDNERTSTPVGHTAPIGAL